MDHRSTRFIRRPVHRKVPRFFLTKDRWKMRALPRSFLGSEGKRACPSMIKSSPEFYPRRVAEHARTVLPLLCPSPSQAHREAGFIFDRTFAPLRSRLRKVERDNRYVFVYSRHLDRWRDAISSFLSFFQPSPLYLLQTIPFIEPLASSDLLFVHPFLTISWIR